MPPQLFIVPPQAVYFLRIHPVSVGVNRHLIEIVGTAALQGHQLLDRGKVYMKNIAIERHLPHIGPGGVVPPFLPSYKNTARSLVWAVSLRKIGSPLLIFIMFPLYTVANVGSYTEFPHNIAGYYVMVYGSGAKYYKLPAVIRHGSSEESEHFHYIEKAFWPNGGTITFSADEYSPVILNKPTTVLFLNDREEYSEIEVMLTAEKCTDSRIPQTAPNVNLAVIASALSVFFLLLYFQRIFQPVLL